MNYTNRWFNYIPSVSELCYLSFLVTGMKVKALDAVSPDGKWIAVEDLAGNQFWAYHQGLVPATAPIL